MVQYRGTCLIITSLSYFKAVGAKNVTFFNAYENIYFAYITQHYIITMLILPYIILHYKTSTNVGTRIGLLQAHGIYKTLQILQTWDCYIGLQEP
jgi:hypothetical protein